MPRCAAPPSPLFPPCCTCTHSSFLALHAASTYKASSPSLPPAPALPPSLARPRLPALSLSPTLPFPSRSATPMRESGRTSERERLSLAHSVGGSWKVLDGCPSAAHSISSALRLDLRLARHGNDMRGIAGNIFWFSLHPVRSSQIRRVRF